MRCPSSKLCGRSVSPTPRKSSLDESTLAVPKVLRPALVPLKPFTPCDNAEAAEPTASPSMSRRSSSSGSSVTGKCVHFHFNPQKLSSYHPAYSRDEYDRSPIVPSGEDLDIPSCKAEGENGWIKCLQRKAREAAREGQPPPFMENMVAKPSPPLTAEPEEMLFSPLDGTFSPSCSSSATSTTHDEESSSCASSEVGDYIRPPHHRMSSLEMSTTMSSNDCEKEIQLHFTHDGNVSDDYDEEDIDKEGRKLGMCALGKWSRSSLYSDDSAFGGF